MAEKRMFAKTIIGSDAFLDMPQSTQLLYFHLSMHADDDGFVNSPKKIMRVVGSKDDDLKLLAIKAFIIPFETGVIVIKHWKINNYIRNDRYSKTDYVELLDRLEVKENGAYTLKNDADTVGIPSGYQTDTQIRLDKSRLDKSSIDILPDATSSTEPNEPVFITLSLVSNEEYPITFSTLEELKPIYPAVNIEQSLRDMKGWLIGNPKNRKTKSGIMRFITGWLSREQNKAKPNNSGKCSNPFLDDLKAMGGLD